MKESLHKELERVLDQFPKYQMKMLLRYFNAKMGTGNVSKPTISNVSLHEISSDNGDRVVSFDTSKNSDY
jgi:hypothetical protein